jgi:hypothetical protein
MKRPLESYPNTEYESDRSALRCSVRFVPVAFAQALYYLLTGVWPLVSISTFQLVTGPKTDLWLVKTVGVLIIIVGMVLLSAGLRRQASLEVWLLAFGSAAGLTVIDIVYSALGQISPIYLLDALLEVAFIIWWVIVWKDQKDSPRRVGVSDSSTSQL